MKGAIKNRIYHKYEKESSKLRMVKGGAWTINLDEVNLDDIDSIIYETSKNIYQVSKKQALRVGISKVLNRESKLIIALSYWKTTRKINVKEK